MTDVLQRVDLTTGELSASPRSEAADDFVATCAALIPAGRSGPASIPGVEPACTLRVSGAGRCLIVTVYGPDDAPLATIGIGGHAVCGASLWMRLHYERADVVTDPHKTPTEPWCALRPEPGGERHPETAQWLDGLASGLAWAFLESLR